jgi:hypothetical protein
VPIPVLTHRRPRRHAFQRFRQLNKKALLGLSSNQQGRMLPSMVRGKSSRGTKKCREFIFSMNSVKTASVILIALTGPY